MGKWFYERSTSQLLKLMQFSSGLQCRLFLFWADVRRIQFLLAFGVLTNTTVPIIETVNNSSIIENCQFKHMGEDSEV